MQSELSDSSALRLDGNAAAGILSEVFARDVTGGRATCASCGKTEHMAELFVYAHGMGTVLRCPGCDAVLLRVSRTPREIWLDASGAKSIVIAVV